MPSNEGHDASPRSPEQESLGRHDLELLAVVVFWGLNLTVAKFGLTEMAPLAFNFIRVAAATGALLAVLAARREGTPAWRRGDALRMALLGLVGHAAYQILFIEGLARTTATHAALIFGLTPILVALLSHALGHERIGARMWAGASLAFGGVYVIIAGMPPPGGPEPTPAGDLLILAATVCWAVYTTLSRPVLARHMPLRMTALTMAWGCLFLAPVSALPVISQDWLSVTGTGWASMTYGIFFPLVFAYLLWYRAIRAVGSFRTALYSNLVPVTGALTGWLVLGERLYPALGLGALAIFSGILLSRWRPDGISPVPTGPSGGLD